SSLRPQELDELLGRRREVLALAMDDADRSQKDLVGQLHHGEGPLAHLGTHGRLGQERQALADLHQPLHGLDVVQLHDVPYLRSVTWQHASGVLPGGNVAFEADERLAREPAHGDLAVTGQWMCRWADEDELVLAERQDRDARPARRVRHDAEVDVAARRILVDLAGAGVLEPQMHLREGLQIALERRGQLVEPDRVYGGDAYRATHDPRRSLELPFHLLEALHDVLAGLVEHLAGRRELDVAARALEQAAAVTVLQHADLLAHGRLRDKVLRRGSGEAPALHDVTEHLEGLQMHPLMSQQRSVSPSHMGGRRDLQQRGAIDDVSGVDV